MGRDLLRPSSFTAMPSLVPRAVEIAPEVAPLVVSLAAGQTDEADRNCARRPPPAIRRRCPRVAFARGLKEIPDDKFPQGRLPSSLKRSKKSPEDANLFTRDCNVRSFAGRCPSGLELYQQALKIRARRTLWCSTTSPRSWPKTPSSRREALRYIAWHSRSAESKTPCSGHQGDVLGAGWLRRPGRRTPENGLARTVTRSPVIPSIGPCLPTHRKRMRPRRYNRPSSRARGPNPQRPAIRSCSAASARV